MSGTILLPEFQYQNLHPTYRDDFVRVPTRLGHMYRYRHAETPYEFESFTVVPETTNNADIFDQWDFEHHLIHAKLVNSIRVEKKQIIIVQCDDEDFLYGAVCNVLALLDESESDWLLEHQYGDVFVLRHLDTIDDFEVE